MTFLPIVDRELRVAARSRFTFWSRLAAAAFALLIFGALQLIAQKSGGAVAAGQLEFAILKWMAFIYACAMGLFLTSDSLSEEKREGTLGLLFLTDLRGYDVVFGKLLTQSLRAFYGLLAAFPIMGLALLAGGVTGKEFSLSIVVICNTLLFSLSLGMLVSSISRDSTKAMNGTLLLLLLVFGGLPFVDSVLAGFNPAKFKAILTLASPAYLFSHTSGYRFNHYWTCLLLQNALAWAFLSLASLRTPHSWQDVSAASVSSRPTFFSRWRFGGPRFRLALRQRLLGRDPVVWLTLRDRWLPRFIWTLTLIVLLTRIWALAVNFSEVYSVNLAARRAASAAANSGPPGASAAASSKNAAAGNNPYRGPTPLTTSPVTQALVQITTTLEGLLHLALYLWVASQASRFFVDAARNGALELVLVTPVSPAQIVRAQWTALLRNFLFPAACLVLLQLTGAFLSIMEMTNNMFYSYTSAGVTMGTNASGGLQMTLYLIGNALIGVLNLIAGLAAVAWFGMWMGLTNRKTSAAVLKTIFFVVVLPWIAFMFARVFLMFAMIPTGIRGSMVAMQWVPVLTFAVLNLGKDGFFIWWSWRHLRDDFRKQLAGDRSRPSVPLRPLARIPRPPSFSPPPVPPAIPPAANAV